MTPPEEHQISNQEAKEIADALAKVLNDGKPVRFRDPGNGWSRDIAPRDPGGLRLKDLVGMAVTIITVIGGGLLAVYNVGGKVKDVESQLTVIPSMQADIKDIKSDQSGFMRELIELKVRFETHEKNQQRREANP